MNFVFVLQIYQRTNNHKGLVFFNSGYQGGVCGVGVRNHFGKSARGYETFLIKFGGGTKSFFEKLVGMRKFCKIFGEKWEGVRKFFGKNGRGYEMF